ncbi:NAD kinase [Belliella sp. DSM 111904]|uniref:NAD kinase n=1 Tax=Belliella filtrata TaxID=2923435 RepID=A0ABS9V5U6_9BACT|nr:NAD kinase [Belliella filtrata]MCH7411800.1 NAD kinase [Belliella filtrata]
MNIAIHGIGFPEEFTPHIAQLTKALTAHGVNIFVTDTFSKLLKKYQANVEEYAKIQSKEMISEMDFIFSIGGDGTLLDTVCYVGQLETPIVGINSGRLGFLATVAKEEIDEAIALLINGDYTIENRVLVAVDTDKQVFNGLNFGLNEFTIHKRDTSSMITIHTYIDGEYLNSYWGDGLIIATPTGSTGYSLSCGGPLITPDARNFVLTPVSPHNLNVRPIILPDDAALCFKVEGRGEKFLVSLDSRSTTIDSGDELRVRKADFVAKLVKFPKYNFFDTLRHKLNWGLDMRN